MSEISHNNKNENNNNIRNSNNVPQFVTRIGDKYYDLKDFDHPGGKISIACSYQRDATELFYSYHQFKDFKKIEKILTKYEVENKDYEIKKISKFDWNNAMTSPFYLDLMEAVRPYFQRNDTKLNFQKGVEIFILIVLTILQYIYLIKGFYFTIITFPITLFALVANVAHDGSHFAFSHNPWLNDLACELIVFITPKYYWMYQHIIGHHCFTNIPGVDPDISVKIYRHHPETPYLPIHKYQPYFPIILPIIRSPIFYLTTTIRCFKDTLFLGGHVLTNSTYLNRFSMIPSALTFLMIIYVIPLLSFGFNLKGFLFSVVPWMVFNLYYMAISGLGHNTPENDSQFDSNFFIHEVITTHNFCTQSYLAYILTGGLNFQIEHHLFPVSFLFFLFICYCYCYCFFFP